jgi:hypothetical protein
VLGDGDTPATSEPGGLGQLRRQLWADVNRECGRWRNDVARRLRRGAGPGAHQVVQHHQGSHVGRVPGQVDGVELHTQRQPRRQAPCRQLGRHPGQLRALHHPAEDEGERPGRHRRHPRPQEQHPAQTVDAYSAVPEYCRSAPSSTTRISRASPRNSSAATGMSSRTARAVIDIIAMVAAPPTVRVQRRCRNGGYSGYSGTSPAARSAAGAARSRSRNSVAPSGGGADVRSPEWTAAPPLNRGRV